MPFSGGGTQTLLCGFFLLLVSVLGHRGPRALLFLVGRRLRRPRLSHALFPPGSFFFFLSLSHIYICVFFFAGPRGREWRARCIGQLQRKNAERCSENSPNISGSGCAASYYLGGHAARFFWEFFFGYFPSYFGVFVRVLSVFGFFSEGFSQRTLELESGVFRGCFLGPEIPLFRFPKTAKEKFSLS